MSLFEPQPRTIETSGHRPLADRMRPETLEDYVGQAHLLGPGKPLRQRIERDELASMILWGPPGSGRAALLVISPHRTPSEALQVGAGLSAPGEFAEVMAAAENSSHYGRRT